jgi:hydrogenase/urease accessory protein HupE
MLSGAAFHGRPRIWLKVLGALVVFWTVAASCFAHDPGISTAQGELRGGEIAMTTGFAPADAQFLLPPALRQDEKWTAEDFEDVRKELLVIAPQLWEIRSGDTTVEPSRVQVDLLPGDNVSFQLLFPLKGSPQRLTLRALKLPDLPPGHRQFVIVANEQGSVITKKLLKAQDAILEVPLRVTGGPGSNVATSVVEPPASDTTAWEFVKLGVEHIWTGYDHLLFLFALLLVCRSFRSVVAITSCFTLAHSLTLALATLNIVNLPARFVEAAIAASIVFVGAENLWRRGAEPPGRWALTFVFGLVHGFGFASVLRDLGVGSGGQGIGMPLFTFNLGVEVGQVAIAAVVLPVVWQLRKREWFIRAGVPVISGIVAVAGLFWLLQRTVL